MGVINCKFQEQSIRFTFIYYFDISNQNFLIWLFPALHRRKISWLYTKKIVDSPELDAENGKECHYDEQSFFLLQPNGDLFN